MSAEELKKKLLKLFSVSSVNAYISKFPQNHTFSADAVGDFIDYINSLQPARRHENEPDIDEY